MYISNRIIYLQTQKTACTHIASLLKKYDGGEIIGKHNPLVDWDKHQGKGIISSIRNPWAWYVSLWAFGCGKRGKVYRHLTLSPQSRLKHAIVQRSPHAIVSSALGLLRRDRLTHRRLSDLYSDATDASNFRAWLALILGDAGKETLPEEYSRTSVRNVIGFFTYRYLQLATRFDAWEKAKFELRTLDQVESVFHRHNIVNRCIRNEHLEEDLADLLSTLGIEVSEADLRIQGRTNESSHRPFESYYDQESSKLVLEREKIIVTTFGYEAPAL